MQHNEFSWQSSDGLKIFAQNWLPDSAPKSVIALVHGMGEHSSRYSNLAEFLVSKNNAVIAFDLRGHGKSEGKQGHTPTYDILLDEIDHLLDYAKKLYKNTPVYLYGHSMGGNLVLNYAIRRKNDIICGVIASSPWIKLSFEPPKVQVVLAKGINHVWPSFTQDTKLDASAISRDNSKVEEYMNDPLVHYKISSNLYLSVYEAGLWLLENGNEIKAPILLYHGSGDKLTSHEATQKFAESIEEQSNVVFKLWEDGYHELHNDIVRDEVYAYLNAWIDEQLIKAKQQKEIERKEGLT